MINLMMGDCLNLMSEIADGSVDLVLTDPPYYSTSLQFDQGEKLNFEVVLNELKRILKPAGILVSFADFNLLAELRSYNAFKTSYELIWQKTMAVGFLDANIRPLRSHEYIGVFTNALKKSTYNPQKTQGIAYERKRINTDKQRCGIYRISLQDPFLKVGDLAALNLC